MPDPTQTKPKLPRSIVRLAVLLLSGALSGAFVACLGTMIEWMLQGELPGAAAPDSTGQLFHVVALTRVEYCGLLVRVLAKEALRGSFFGFLGGVLTALIAHYWSSATGLKQASLLWAILLTVGLVLIRLSLGGLRAQSSFELGRFVLLVALIGAIYGVLISVFAQQFGKLVRSEKK